MSKKKKRKKKQAVDDRISRGTYRGWQILQDKYDTYLEKEGEKGILVDGENRRILPLFMIREMLDQLIDNPNPGRYLSEGVFTKGDVLEIQEIYRKVGLELPADYLKRL